MSNVVSVGGALQSLQLYRLQRCFNLCDEVLDVAIAAIEELKQYRAIGTVEEFRELKEKATPKKPIAEEVTKAIYEIKAYRCPVCRQKLISKIDGSWCGGTQSKHCDQCGTAIDWSEGKE